MASWKRHKVKAIVGAPVDPSPELALVSYTNKAVRLKSTAHAKKQYARQHQESPKRRCPTKHSSSRPKEGRADQLSAGLLFLVPMTTA